MPPSDAPLSSEERALARRLAELDPLAAPSPALDARVLAAARDAGRRPMTRRRRWPAMLGAAASVLLAVGLLWKLRPLVLPPPVPVGTPQAADGREEVPGTAVPAPSAPPPMAAKQPAPAGQAGTPMHKPVPMPRAIPPPPEPPVVLDNPAPAPMAPPAPPPPPAPPRESTPSPAPAPAAIAPAPPAESNTQDAAREADRAAAGSTARGDEPEDDVPPATADSPSVRDAWLQRIHGLVDSGDIAAARTSLRAFMQRYPDYVLPEDLRALAR